MRSVMLSIQPKWCELIANGKKTVEVRKTRPKCDEPFRVYIYCSSIARVNLDEYTKIFRATNGRIDDWHGKVIGEFVCDEVIEFYEETLVHDELDGSPTESWMNWEISDKLCEEMSLYTMEDVVRCTCLTEAELISYLYPKMQGYGWHISDLVIYDKPKELSKFFVYCGDNPKCEGCEAFHYSNTESGKEEYCCSVVDGCRPLKRPPQSWCYVEEGGVDK